MTSLSNNHQITNYEEQLISLSVTKGLDSQEVQSALNLAKTFYYEQYRKNMDPLVLHYIRVAELVLELSSDKSLFYAALLSGAIDSNKIHTTKHSNNWFTDHEARKQNNILDEITEKFGKDTALLIKTVSRLDQITKNSNKRYTELFILRKLLIAISKDVRVLIIRLAIRMDNMRTIDALSTQKQKEYSDETLKVYSPLAEYIGVGRWKRELDDIAFKKNDATTYQFIEQKVYEDKSKYDALLDEIIKETKQILSKNNIHFTNIFGRNKSVSSIYNKFLKYKNDGRVSSLKNFNFKSIKDYVALSIVLDNVELECYRVLGIIHSKYKYSSQDFQDYIAKPKKNGYRSIHTVIKYRGINVEIQIKTSHMHHVNEFGAASHIAYNLAKTKDVTQVQDFSWIQELNQWNQQKTITKYEIKAFTDKIFAITPKGKVIELKKDSTAIDFAYAVHSSVGNRCSGVKVNGNIEKLDYKIQNGDIVEIIVSKNEKLPNTSWLELAKQSSTKSKIRRFLRLHAQNARQENAKNELSVYIQKAIKIDFLHADTSTINYVLGETGCKDINTLYLRIANKHVPKIKILKLLINKLNLPINAEEIEKKPRKRVKKSTKLEKTRIKKEIFFEGIKGLDYKVAKCCYPTENDNIIGIATLRDGLKIHKKSCPNIKEFRKDKILKAYWK